jgi:hypothetical protein
MKIKLTGKCFWYEKGKFLDARVHNAIYDDSEGRLTADYEYDLYGGTRGSLAVAGKEVLSGTWKETAPKDKWDGQAPLIYTTRNRKHVFVGTWMGEGESGYGGPGAFVFDLDEP